MRARVREHIMFYCGEMIDSHNRCTVIRSISVMDFSNSLIYNELQCYFMECPESRLGYLCVCVDYVCVCSSVYACVFVAGGRNT